MSWQSRVKVYCYRFNLDPFTVLRSKDKNSRQDPLAVLVSPRCREHVCIVEGMPSKFKRAQYVQLQELKSGGRRAAGTGPSNFNELGFPTPQLQAPTSTPLLLVHLFTVSILHTHLIHHLLRLRHISIAEPACSSGNLHPAFTINHQASFGGIGLSTGPLLTSNFVQRQLSDNSPSSLQDYLQIRLLITNALQSLRRVQFIQNVASIQSLQPAASSYSSHQSSVGDRLPHLISRWHCSYQCASIR